MTSIKKKNVYSGKSLPEKMVAMMLPGGPADVGTSRLNMAGVGPAFFGYLMKKHNVESLANLVELAVDLGVKLNACQMSMGVMGIVKDELMDGVELGGAAACLGDCCESQVTLFI